MTPSSTSAAVNKKKSLCFNPRTSIYLIPTLSSISDEDFNLLYMNDDDNKRIQKDAVQTIAAMRACQYNTANPHEEYCSLIRANSVEQRKATKDRVLNAGLDEQDSQWERGEFDADRIAEASVLNAANTVAYARMLGESDQAFAKLLTHRHPRFFKHLSR